MVKGCRPKVYKKKENHVVVSEMRVLANLILIMTAASLNDKLCAQNILEREHVDTFFVILSDISQQEKMEKSKLA